MKILYESEPFQIIKFRKTIFPDFEYCEKTSFRIRFEIVVILRPIMEYQMLSEK
jgi:hypothetical protein